MDHRTVVLICLCITYITTETDNIGFGVLNKLYSQCYKTSQPIKCFKIKALKIVDRALHSPSFGITENLKIVSTQDTTGQQTPEKVVNIKDEALERLNSTEIDNLLYNAATRFLSSHRLEINLPRLIEEGRGKKKGYGGGPFAIALAIKGFFMALAYKGVAIMSAGAILIGKMALLLSALLGLKKLVNGGHEKTTFEIVKHPVYSQSHTHSSSHHSDGDDGHFYRALGSEEEMMMQDRFYRNHLPRN